MLRLRPYKHCDAEKIASWLQDEDVYLKWGGKLIGEFPLSAETIDRKYSLENGACEEPDNFYPWVALDDENNVAGHFIMRYMHGDRRIVRFGWVVVDSSARGKGVGTEMLRAGLKYAFELLGAEVITIGVFVNNDNAHRCYRKAGFTDAGIVEKEPWNVIEMELKKEDYFAEGVK